MAQQTFQLPADIYLEGDTFLYWRFPFQERPAINDAFHTETGQARLLIQVSVNLDGSVRLYIGGSQNDPIATTGQSLDTLFEQSGGLDLTVGAFSLSVNLAGADTNDPYIWIPSNSAEVIQFRNDVLALTGDQAATLVLRDFTGIFNMRVGSAIVNKVYLGSTEVTKVYLGSTLIHQS